MTEEFSSTNKISYTALGFLISACKRKEKYKIFKRGQKKLEEEFDILKIIRHHRLLAC